MQLQPVRTYAICTCCFAGINTGFYGYGTQSVYLESTIECEERLQLGMKAVEATLRSLPAHFRVKPFVFRRNGHRQYASYASQTQSLLVGERPQACDPIRQAMPWTVKSITRTANGNKVVCFDRNFYLCVKCKRRESGRAF
jgi:hypothetical protein